MPLILLGDAKKVIVISSGMGDTELTRQYDLWMGTAYSVSKAALNMVVAKYSAEYREKGVVVLAISPGVVDTGMSGKLTRPRVSPSPMMREN
jgi:NAD(P)-dependent dehydrogenase (short-subunit alcohol dehydrogenase family)